jgi:hypothetical protein
MEKKYYLYLHKYQNTGEVFYVGVGSSKDFKRAFTPKGRNKYWYQITEKNKYSVEVLLKDLTKEEAFEKEKEFILYYGRKDLKTGNLVNMTPGGEGLQEWTLELRQRLRQSKLGKKLSKETMEKLTGSNSFFSKKVINLENGDIFGCIKEAAEFLKVSSNTLGRWLNGKRHNPTQLVFLDEKLRKESKPKKIRKEIIRKGRGKSILQYDLQGNFIQEFKSVKKAWEFLGKTYATSINKCAKGNTSQAYGYIWKFKNSEI